MKRILCTIMAITSVIMAFSQTDTSSRDRIDTIKVGNFIIIKKNKDGSQTSDTTNKDKHYTVDINIGGRDNEYDDESNNNRSKKGIIFDLKNRKGDCLRIRLRRRTLDLLGIDL